MENYPLVSVVIPTLNEEKYLPHCLLSLTKQTYKNFEIIVSDGGSTDNTIQAAKSFKAKIVIIPHSTITIARQKGVAEALGDIIVGADADTTYPPNHLEMIVSDFQKDQNIVAVGGGGEFESKPWWVHISWRAAYFIFGKIFQWLGVVVYAPAFNLSFKKNVFNKIGGYNTYLDFGGDELDMLARLKRVGRVYFDVRLHPNPSSRRAKVGFWSMLIKHTLIDYYLNYFLAKIFKKPILRGKPVR